LRQVLTNLVGNAVKFTVAGEVVVQVALEKRTEVDARIRFVVTDTGIGIPEHMLRLIFQPFTQADNSTTRKYGGTGLGLAIASHLVQMMGGTINAESREGGGSIFHFTAPFLLQRIVHGSRASDGLPRDVAVLVVDDNAISRNMLRDILTGWSMKPTMAGSAQEALTLLDEAMVVGKPFPLVLVDAQMPQTDGFFLAERIKRQDSPKSSVVVMLTATDVHRGAARCRELGICEYVAKPAKESELLRAIKSALGCDHSTAEKPSAVTGSNGAPTRQLRILVAEDNPINQTLTTRLLQKRGHTVAIAETGKAALELSEKESFDLILMDIQMPEMDGLEVAATIRRRERPDGKRIPIIAMTAHAMVGDRDRCLLAGMDHYLSKPLDRNQLFAAIEHVCVKTDVDSPAPES
jgi:CheY-like chemotaxis protein/anti-sigma regulatory factor (Ser/Thr protein kinase)